MLVFKNKTGKKVNTEKSGIYRDLCFTKRLVLLFFFFSETFKIHFVFVRLRTLPAKPSIIHFSDF